MLFLFVIVFCCAVVGIKYSPEQTDYLGREQSNAIKGIFVLIVFCCHQWQYSGSYAQPGILSTGFSAVSYALGQMIVVPFLFYSGYGIRCSIEDKGERYVKALPCQRIAKTYLHTVLMVALFLVMQLMFGTRYSAGFIIKSFVLWESFGNSNWYMLAVIALYFSTYIAFKLAKNTKNALAVNLLLVLAYIAIMCRFKEAYWCDTVIAYWFGMVFYGFREKFSGLLSHRTELWIAVIALSMTAYAGIAVTKGHFQLPIKVTMGNIEALFFMLVILAVTTRFTVKNRLLIWLGGYVFEIYILQRLPMIAFEKVGLLSYSVIIWLAASAACTVILAILAKKLLIALDKRIFAKRV